MIWRTICLFAGLCSMVVSLFAQTSNWQNVEQLRPGTVISVAKLLRQECEFVKATDVDLTCDRVTVRFIRKLVFAREQVREVRLELPEHDRLIAGVLAGAVVGGLVGILARQRSNDPETRGYSLVYGVPIGAFVGGAVGVHMHRHGAVIYRK